VLGGSRENIYKSILIDMKISLIELKTIIKEMVEQQLVSEEEGPWHKSPFVAEYHGGRDEWGLTAYYGFGNDQKEAIDDLIATAQEAGDQVNPKRILMIKKDGVWIGD